MKIDTTAKKNAESLAWLIGVGFIAFFIIPIMIVANDRWVIKQAEAQHRACYHSLINTNCPRGEWKKDKTHDHRRNTH